MNSDVRDILDMKQSSGSSKMSKKKKMKRLVEPIKRPQGVHREVWGLICKDDMDQPPLIPNEEPKLYQHPKARLRHGVRKWNWIPFKNPARIDQAEFCHWRCVNDDPNKEYLFAKYNKHIQFARYTDTEYNQYLIDENWTKIETDYLLELCQQFDLRFFVIHDRWDASRFVNAKSRSIDELKDRYYKVIGVMQKLKVGEDSQTYVFDLEHEQKRREQLEKLFNRTKEQVDEELYLIEELKKIEIRKREREKKQQDVNKLLTAVVDLESSSNRLSTSTSTLLKNRVSNENQAAASLNNNKRVKNRNSGSKPFSSTDQLNKSLNSLQTTPTNSNKLNTSMHLPHTSGNNSLNNSTENLHSPSSSASNSIVNTSFDSKNKKQPLIFKAVVESTGIKFTDNKVAGVSLRSYKMKLPQSVGLKKTKAIEQLVDELQLDQKPIATEPICEQFNELRSDMVLLYELHQALTN